VVSLLWRNRPSGDLWAHLCKRPLQTKKAVVRSHTARDGIWHASTVSSNSRCTMVRQRLRVAQYCTYKVLKRVRRGAAFEWRRVGCLPPAFRTVSARSFLALAPPHPLQLEWFLCVQWATSLSPLPPQMALVRGNAAKTCRNGVHTAPDGLAGLALFLFLRACAAESALGEPIRTRDRSRSGPVHLQKCFVLLLHHFETPRLGSSEPITVRPGPHLASLSIMPRAPPCRDGSALQGSRRSTMLRISASRSWWLSSTGYVPCASRARGALAGLGLDIWVDVPPRRRSVMVLFYLHPSISNRLPHLAFILWELASYPPSFFFASPSQCIRTPLETRSRETKHSWSLLARLLHLRSWYKTEPATPSWLDSCSCPPSASSLCCFLPHDDTWVASSIPLKARPYPSDIVLFCHTLDTQPAWSITFPFFQKAKQQITGPFYHPKSKLLYQNC